MSEREWQAWAEGADPDALPPGIDPYPPDDFGPVDARDEPLDERTEPYDGASLVDDD